MKKNLFILTPLFIATSLLFVSCIREGLAPVNIKIEGLTKENYPKVDGSTSALPLQQIIAAKLLNIQYRWLQRGYYDNLFEVASSQGTYAEDFLRTAIVHHGTHESYVNLIDKKADFILVARKPSADELQYAGEENIEFIVTPVALDAFTFVKNPQNTVKGLSTKQIQDIYTGKITNWKEVGGTDAKITPYVRDANSGSQELMDELVMKGVPVSDFPIEILSGMIGPFSRIRNEVNSLGYTVFYFKTMIVREEIVSHLSVDGVFPDKHTIKNKTYPYTAEVYAVIRKGTDVNSMAYKLNEILLTPNGQRAVEESGYVPISK